MRPHLPTCLLTILALGGIAQAAETNPPARVGRLSYLQGSVSFRAPGDQDWSQPALNYPVTTGDALWTDAASRAEVQVGPAELRMDATTEVEMTELDDAATNLQLDQGTINVHLGALPPGGVQVQTPRGPVSFLQPGSYHVDVTPALQDAPPQLQVTVLEGQATLGQERSTVTLKPGESALVSGDPASVTLAEGDATPFDNWALSRERREEASASLRYLSPNVTGYEDLDSYGQWDNDPQYGAVWYPAGVAADWAPYRYGHWASVAPWGWTWVDDAPWGFAPFHYGRWMRNGTRWGWAPGAIAERPVYAPALVAFIGGPGWSVSIGGGQPVGWVPLAPFEPYRPYYHASPQYVRNVNITNVHSTQINNITTINKNAHYANAQAATVVPATAFTRGAPVHRAQVTLRPEQLAAAPVAESLAHLTPAATPRAAPAPRPGKFNPPPVARAPAAIPAPKPSVQTARFSPPEHAAPAPAIAHAEGPPAQRTTFKPAEQPRPKRSFAPPVAKPEKPQAAVAKAPEPPHPVQQTRIAPTPQGWVRTPSHAAPAHPHEHAPEVPQSRRDPDKRG